jgi:hypothetical protein
VEDALLAYERGADGILISNHGGRQLDTTRPCLDVLLEIRKHAPQLLRPEFRGDTGLNPGSLKNLVQVTPPTAPGKMERPFEVYIDGGINRGTDVVKALCLGANAVGVGRGFLFAQSVGGVKGVEHAVGSKWTQGRSHTGNSADLASPAIGDTTHSPLIGRQQVVRAEAKHGGGQAVNISYIFTYLKDAKRTPDGRFRSI